MTNERGKKGKWRNNISLSPELIDNVKVGNKEFLFVYFSIIQTLKLSKMSVFRLEESPDKDGWRNVVSTTDLVPGQLILKEEALIFASRVFMCRLETRNFDTPAEQQQNTNSNPIEEPPKGFAYISRCANLKCGKWTMWHESCESESSKPTQWSSAVRCPGCKYSLFCSDTCFQFANARYHHKICNREILEHILALAAVYLAMDQPHVEWTNPMVTIAQSVESVKVQLLQGIKLLSRMFPKVPIHQVVECCCRFWYGGTYTKTFLSQRLTGLSFFPIASKFKHSCEPNCYFYTEGNNIYVRALHPIAKRERLTICIDMDLYFTSTYFREDALKEALGRWCKCTRCSSDEHRKKDLHVFQTDYFDENWYSKSSAGRSTSNENSNNSDKPESKKYNSLVGGRKKTVSKSNTVARRVTNVRSSPSSKPIETRRLPLLCRLGMEEIMSEDRDVNKIPLMLDFGAQYSDFFCPTHTVGYYLFCKYTGYLWEKWKVNETVQFLERLSDSIVGWLREGYHVEILEVWRMIFITFCLCYMTPSFNKIVASPKKFQPLSGLATQKLSLIGHILTCHTLIYEWFGGEWNVLELERFCIPGFQQMCNFIQNSWKTYYAATHKSLSRHLPLDIVLTPDKSKGCEKESNDSDSLYATEDSSDDCNLSENDDEQNPKQEDRHMQKEEEIDEKNDEQPNEPGQDLPDKTYDLQTPDKEKESDTEEQDALTEWNSSSLVFSRMHADWLTRQEPSTAPSFHTSNTTVTTEIIHKADIIGKSDFIGIADIIGNKNTDNIRLSDSVGRNNDVGSTDNIGFSDKVVLADDVGIASNIESRVFRVSLYEANFTKPC